MHAPVDCPGPECWQTVLSAALPPDEQERYEQHLLSCESCRARLEGAGDGGEPLLLLARRLGHPTVLPRDPAVNPEVPAWLEQLIARLMALAGLLLVVRRRNAPAAPAAAPA